MNTAQMTAEILAAGWTQQQVADFCGVAQSTVGRWKKGLDPEGPNRDRLFELYRKVIGRPAVRELTRVPLDDDADDEFFDPEASGFTREHWQPKFPGAIPELDISAGAGEGTVGNVIVLPAGGGTISAHEVVDEWPLPSAWLHEVVNNPALTIIVPIRGESMVPNYLPGDRVVVDLSQDRFTVDSVYLISDGTGEPQIKRLQKMQLTLPPRVKIISDNSAYPDQEVELDLLTIHGRVCAYVGRR